MQRTKEAASNVAASARSGMEKTKATLEEKAEKMTTRDPLRKEMAEEKKDERYREAELEKQVACDQNAVARQTHGAHGYTTGVGGPVREGYPSRVTRGVVGSQYPAGVDAGSGRRTGVLDQGRDVAGDERPGVQDPRVAGGHMTSYGSY